MIAATGETVHAVEGLVGTCACIAQCASRPRCGARACWRHSHTPVTAATTKLRVPNPYFSDIYSLLGRLACMHARGIAAHTRSLVGSDQVRWRSCISTVKVPDRWIPDCGGS
eukprot:1195698-Prorocentrum_minimum.AAC.1